ncbi:MAG TPA: DUF1684 domain-containing protein [Bryobacteraceae bacterium]|nr:DUF1684 domain-containing protein [Bryobacteraceae bacterium]
MPAAILLAFCTVLVAAGSTAYVDEAAKWRASYEESLKAPSGWLAVAGLFWLHPGVNVVGSDPQSDVVLPASAPKRAGILRFGNGKTIWEPVSGAKLTLNSDMVHLGSLAFNIIERGGKTGVRLRDPNAETVRNFTGCKWFSADEHWRVKAKWVSYPQPKTIPITNILGMTDQEPAPGYAEFAVKGQTYRLEPVIEDDQLFFMFKDSTSGKTTYGAGRFFYAPIPKAGATSVELDFNQAHNPPCAFTAFATCPLPPKQNTMAIPVEAGEKNYGHH